MKRERTLLGRIGTGMGSPRKANEATANVDVDAIMESVRMHLVRLLNARHGMSECVPDYGLPAMADLSVDVGNYVQIVQDAIQNTIDQYEPRLRRARVTQVIDEDEQRSVSFRVDAVLGAGGREHRVWYQTSMSGDGQFDVEG